MKKLLRAVLYVGLNVIGPFFFSNFCPLCKSFVYKFRDGVRVPGQATIDRYHIISMGRRPHYRCPRCNSSDKERLVWLYLQTQLDIEKSWNTYTVLHIAPEKMTQRLLSNRPNIAYIAGDMFEGDERYTTQRYKNTMYLDVTDLSTFDDNSFDLIICNHVLEHVPNDTQAMKELYRVLKPRGTAILNVPVSRTIPDTIEQSVNSPEERLALFGQTDHVRIYQEDDYVRRLTAVGFTVTPKGMKEISGISSNIFGVNLEEKVYAVRK